jgi:hypothetical protein
MTGAKLSNSTNGFFERYFGNIEDWKCPEIKVLEPDEYMGEGKDNETLKDRYPRRQRYS